MQFVRAPDENVFIAPFNLVEIFLLVLPFEWWMPKVQYERLNDIVMGIIYSPLLAITAGLETRQAHHVNFNRKQGEDDDDTVEEWEELQGDCDFEADGWNKKVQQAKPDVEGVGTEVKLLTGLRKEVKELRELILSLKKEENGKGVEEK
jgi:hypothetical protein